MAIIGSNLILFYVGVFFTLFVAIFYLVTLLENRGRVKDPVPKRFPRISIVVPAYNEEKNIQKTLKSLQRLDYPKEKLDLIFVDDGSTDNTYEIAKKFKGVRVFRKENGGKGSAVNFGIKRARGEFVAVLDADSFVSRGSLKKMVGYFEREKVMAVTPALKVYNPKGFWQRVQYVEYLFSMFFRKIFSFLQGVYVTPGPLSIYRKSFFKKHGYFDEKNITEDLEIALRIQSNNYEIQNSINASVYTVAPNSFRGLMTQRVRWFTGLVDNLYSYKHLFGRNYGSLGMFILPVVGFSIILMLAHLFYYGFSFFSNIIKNMHQIYLVNFDIGTVLQGYISSFSMIKIVNPISVLFLVLLISSIFTLFLAKTFYPKSIFFYAQYYSLFLLSKKL